MKLAVALYHTARLLVRWANHEMDRAERAYGGKAWR